MESVSAAFQAETSAHAGRRIYLDNGTPTHMTSSSGHNIPSDRILTSPNYSYVFGFEKDFDHVEVKEVCKLEYIVLIIK